MNRKRRGDPRFQHAVKSVLPASLLMSCRVCRKLHDAEAPLEFHPNCPACERRCLVASPQVGGRHPLDQAEIDEAVRSERECGNYLDFAEAYGSTTSRTQRSRKLRPGSLPFTVIITDRGETVGF